MRRALFILGLFTLAAVWLTDLPQVARQAFWAHMTMHMAVVAVAAPFIALGVAGTRFDPVRKTPKFYAPIPASLVELAVVWIWHAPVLHQFARHNVAGLIAEQASFIISGLLMWLSAFGGEASCGRNRSATGVVGLLLTSMHMTLLGALLALSPRPLYWHETHAVAAVPTILTALQDQHLGGAIMLLVGGLSYLIGGLGLTAGLVQKALPKQQEKA